MPSSPALRRNRSSSRSRSHTPSNNHYISRSIDYSRDPRGSRESSLARSRSPVRRHSSSRTRSPTRSHRDRSYTRSPSPDQAVIPRSAKIVIEKLTKNVNENHLHEVFGSYGEIQELEMPTNKQFMMNKGIAYILYADSDQAAEAIAHMHEAQLDGALISVSIVLPRRRFSRSPPPKRPPPNRFGEPHRFRDGPARQPLSDRSYGARSGFGRALSPFRSGHRNSSPPVHSSGRNGGEHGYRDRYDDRRSYRPRSVSPRQPSTVKRRRSPSYISKDRRSWSRSLSPDRRR